jgi:hypothetical protein
VHVEPHQTADELERLASAETRAKLARRLMAVRLALTGRTAAEAVRLIPGPRMRHSSECDPAPFPRAQALRAAVLTAARSLAPSAASVM